MQTLSEIPSELPFNIWSILIFCDTSQQPLLFIKPEVFCFSSDEFIKLISGQFAKAMIRCSTLEAYFSTVCSRILSHKDTDLHLPRNLIEKGKLTRPEINRVRLERNQRHRYFDALRKGLPDHTSSRYDIDCMEFVSSVPTEAVF